MRDPYDQGTTSQPTLGLGAQIRALLAKAPKTLGGERKPTWADLVVPPPSVTGGAKADPNHPSRKHDGDLAPSYAVKDLPDPTDPRSRRRDRRRVSVYIDSQERKARRRVASRG